MEGTMTEAAFSGMFDWVTIRADLMDPAERKRDWQTKSLADPALREYDIAPNGTLTLGGALVPIDGDIEIYDLNDDATERIECVITLLQGVVTGLRRTAIAMGDSSHDEVSAHS